MYKQEELSIYDLWMLIARRKKLFWFVVAIVLVVGIIFTISKPKHYKYTQAIQIAQYSNAAGKILPIIASPAVIAKTKTIYLTVVLKKYKKEHDLSSIAVSPKRLIITSLSSKNGTDSGLIALSITGTTQQRTAYADLFQKLLDQLSADTTPKITRQQQYLKNYLATLKQQLGNQTKFGTTLQRAVIVSANRDNTKIDQQWIMASQQASIGFITTRIAKAQQQLSVLQDSHFASDFIRSMTPVGVSWSVLILLSIIMGLIFGFIAVFIAEFFVKLEAIKKEQQSGKK